MSRLKQETQLGRLWEYESTSGRTYYRGDITIDGIKTKIVMFPVFGRGEGIPAFEIHSLRTSKELARNSAT